MRMERDRRRAERACPPRAPGPLNSVNLLRKLHSFVRPPTRRSLSRRTFPWSNYSAAFVERANTTTPVSQELCRPFRFRPLVELSRYFSLPNFISWRLWGFISGAGSRSNVSQYRGSELALMTPAVPGPLFFTFAYIGWHLYTEADG